MKGLRARDSKVLVQSSAAALQDTDLLDGLSPRGRPGCASPELNQVYVCFEVRPIRCNWSQLVNRPGFTRESGEKWTQRQLPQRIMPKR